MALLTPPSKMASKVKKSSPPLYSRGPFRPQPFSMGEKQFPTPPPLQQVHCVPQDCIPQTHVAGGEGVGNCCPYWKWLRIYKSSAVLYSPLCTQWTRCSRCGGVGVGKCFSSIENGRGGKGPRFFGIFSKNEEIIHIGLFFKEDFGFMWKRRSWRRIIYFFQFFHS